MVLLKKKRVWGLSSLRLLERLVSDLRIQLSSCILGKLRIDLFQIMCDVELFGLDRSV